MQDNLYWDEDGCALWMNIFAGAGSHHQGSSEGCSQGWGKGLVFVFSIRSMMESLEGLLWVKLKCSLRQMETQRMRLSGRDSITRRVPLVLMGIWMASLCPPHIPAAGSSLAVPLRWVRRLPLCQCWEGERSWSLKKHLWLIHAQLTSREGITQVTCLQQVWASI